MSIALMTEVWKSNLPMTEKMVLLCLADFANDRGECWPAVDTIAGKCSCSDRTVQKAIKSLKDMGCLTIEDAPGKTHRFIINPRISFTPEKSSPPKIRANGVKNIHHRGEARSPKPSLNRKEPSKVKSSAGDDAISPKEILEEWNDLAATCGLAKAGKLTGARLRQAQARLREYPELESWQRAFRHIRETPFLRGENDRGWRCDIDFLLQAKSFTKLTEESYGKA